jgi:Domain of unknown function (DUF3883)
MPRKLVLKRLKASDLSFFGSYLSRHPQTKQKGFNLDKAVLETALFPGLSRVVADMPGQRAPVSLSLFGPGGAQSNVLMRKILKQYNNWRLNGEHIPDPDDAPRRYDVLAPGDIAIMEFSGGGAPDAVKVVLLAAADPADAATHSALSAAFPADSMTVLSEADLQRVLATSLPSPNHPILDWLDDDLIEDAALGGAAAAETLFKRRFGRAMSPAELKKRKEQAEDTGRLGEELLDFHFAAALPARVLGYEWIAKTNAVAPYDFRLDHNDGIPRHVDAKSTSGSFDNPIHLSAAEISHAVSSGVPYHLYRLYGVTETRAKVRVAEDIAGKLAPIAAALSAMPTGVKADSLSFAPAFFEFE